MKISIITVVYNGEETIRDTIDSILTQTYKNIECIIIDGGSRDRTLEIIKSYNQKISTVVSEPDNGIYDAMNKGIRLATGDIIAILNSDDLYTSQEVLEKVAHEFQKNEQIECVYGDLEYVDKKDTHKVVRAWKSQSYTPSLFIKGWHPPHPAFFIRKNTYLLYGMYRTDLKISSDYEMMLRLLEVKKVKSMYIPSILVKMRTGGASNKSWFNIIKANFEVLKAWKLNNLPVPYFVFFKKPFSKLKQLH